MIVVLMKIILIQIRYYISKIGYAGINAFSKGIYAFFKLFLTVFLDILKLLESLIPFISRSKRIRCAIKHFITGVMSCARKTVLLIAEPCDHWIHIMYKGKYGSLDENLHYRFTIRLNATNPSIHAISSG